MFKFEFADLSENQSWVAIYLLHECMFVCNCLRIWIWICWFFGQSELGYIISHTLTHVCLIVLVFAIVFVLGRTIRARSQYIVRAHVCNQLADKLGGSSGRKQWIMWLCAATACKTDGDVALGVVRAICHFANVSTRRGQGAVLGRFHFGSTWSTHALALHQEQKKKEEGVVSHIRPPVAQLRTREMKALLPFGSPSCHFCNIYSIGTTWNDASRKTSIIHAVFHIQGNEYSC